MVTGCRPALDRKKYEGKRVRTFVLFKYITFNKDYAKHIYMTNMTHVP